MGQTSKIQMMIQNAQGAHMGTFCGDTPAELLQSIRNSNYNLSDCTGSTDLYIYEDDKILENSYDRHILAE